MSLTRLQCLAFVGFLACSCATFALSPNAARAQVSPIGSGAERPPTAAKASSPSPETGKQLEPQLFGFIFLGGGIICAIAVNVADRRVRSDHARYGTARR